ncbi:MAG: glycosyltransferase family 4 protein [Calditrichaeota bacterium]|nr:glycosyltransferase family 4 protein [Calditrichota bacterium]
MSDQKYNILQVCSSQSWGGMEMHVPELSRALAERGHRVIVAAFPGSPLMREAEALGLTTYSLPLRSYWHPIQQQRLRRFISQNAIQIIHSHYSRDLWTLVPAIQKWKNIPLFLTKHIGTQRPKSDFFHRKIYARVDKILANSRVIYENILKTHPVHKSQVELFHLGIDTRRFKPDRRSRNRVREEFSIPQNALVIGIAGRLQRAKGYLEFLEMAEILSGLYPNTYFMLIGGASRGEDEEENLIRKKADKLQLGNRLVFTGFRKNIENMLQALDIFVFPSHAEAYGLVVLEAMAVGLPVVSSNCDGILDIVVSGETGELVPPKEVSRLVNRVEALIRSPEKRSRYGQRGRERVQKYFDFNTMIDHLEQLYRKSVNRRMTR